ncbi:MAG: glycosyltransferase family 2 protein [Bacteroidales bacterium]|nr:glycosyltransferase family 2 protein [Bacteroidales bacterium]
MRVAVVILNWNNLDYLRRFVPGILGSLGADDKLFVADSGSEDGSLDYLADKHPEVGLIPLGKNYGFAEGYNKALAQIDGAEYYLLLNSDIEVGENWLEPLVLWMESHPRCGVCGPKLHALDRAEDGGWLRTDRFEYAGAAGGWLDHYGFPYCRGRVLQTVEFDRGQYDTPAKVFWITGACLMVRSKLWKELGGLDGEFFAHMEEIDFCWRVQLAGGQVWTVPQSVVWHIGGGTLAPASPLKLKLNYRNSLWMLRKNLPATVGVCKARSRIALRKIIDFGTQVVYLLQGKLSYVKAVSRARREARARKITPTEGGAPVALTKVRIITAWAFRGKKVFEYLRKYESSN